MTTTPPRLRLTAAVDADNTPTLYRDGRVVAVRRDTPADPQHLAAPPALDPDVYDLLAAVADPSDAVRKRIADALYEHDWDESACQCGWEPVPDAINGNDHVDHQAREVFAALREVTRG